MALEEGEVMSFRLQLGTTVTGSRRRQHIKSIICHASGTGINTATGGFFTPTGVTTGPADF